MLKKTILFAVVAGLVLALAPPAQAQVSFATGFEPNEDPGPLPGYTVGYDNMDDGVAGTPGQGGWDTQFGGPWHCQDYATGSIPWSPPSLAGVPPVSFYTPPVNPTGGEQYVGKGTALAGGSGGGRLWHAAAQNGPIVNVDIDFCNASEHDYPNYQGSIVSRGNWVNPAGPGNMVGIYTSVSSTWVEPPQPNPTPPPPNNPRQGNWAYAVMAFDEFDTQFAGTLAPFYRFDGVAGFDELPRETWWRMGYSYDPISRRITQFRSDDLTDGVGGALYWEMDNPQGLMDYGLGPVLADMYLNGGSPLNGNPDENTAICDAVGLYNVGNGQISMWDNLVVDNVPEPATMALLAFGGLGVLLRRRRR